MRFFWRRRPNFRRSQNPEQRKNALREMREREKQQTDDIERLEELGVEIIRFNAQNPNLVKGQQEEVVDNTK